MSFLKPSTAEFPPGVTDAFLSKSVTHEDEEALDSIEDAKEVLEDQTSISDGQEAKNPGESYTIIQYDSCSLVDYAWMPGMDFNQGVKTDIWLRVE